MGKHMQAEALKALADWGLLPLAAENASTAMRITPGEPAGDTWSS